MPIDRVEVQFGAVQYTGEVEAIPATSKTTGNVTVNNMGSPGRAERFDVTFMLICGSGDDSSKENIFHWTERLAGLPRDTPYSEVELQAFRQLAPNLRAAADLIDQQIVEIDSQVSGQSPT